MPLLHVNGADIHCHVQGEGPAILMVHPPFLGSKVFNYLKNDLSQDHRVVTFDVRGHGHSEPSDAGITIPMIAEDMKQLLDKLDIEEASVLGYSCGAMPAFEAMIAHPDRFTAGIMLSGMSELTDKKSRRLMKAGTVSNRIRAKEPVVVPVAMANSDSRTTFGVLHAEGMAGHAECHRRYAEACIGYSCTDRLRRIGGPVLLLCGQDDPTGIGYGRFLHERLPVSELYILKDALHHLPTKAQDKTSAVIRAWVAKREGREDADTFFERMAIDRDLLQQGIINDRQADFGNPQGL